MTPPAGAPAPTPDLTFPLGTVLVGNSLDRLRELPDASVHAVVCDPPYGMADLPADKVASALTAWLTGDRAAMPAGRGFMGRSWDAFVPPPALWDEVLRVLTPGGHVLAFASSRTQDLMALSLRLAGFEIRDALSWNYGSGFPKSHNVGKALDKLAPRAGLFAGFAEHYEQRRKASGLSHAAVCAAGGFHGDVNHGGASVNWGKGHNVPTLGQWAVLSPLLGLADEWLPLIERVEAEREVVGQVDGTKLAVAPGQDNDRGAAVLDITAPATDAAKQWDGWGTALKPSQEPIIVARKPLAGTVAQTVLAHGTGALNIDGTRVGSADGFGGGRKGSSGFVDGYEGDGFVAATQGRWPANTLLTHSAACVDECAADCPVAELDRQSGTSKSPAVGSTTVSRRNFDPANIAMNDGTERSNGYGDQGGASRFYPTSAWDPELDDATRFLYCAKPGKRERNAGLDHLDERAMPHHVAQLAAVDGRPPAVARNTHPTVKPVAVMDWLIRLVTPPGGVVLDPFLGSGTTAVAATLAGVRFIGCEMTADYLPIIAGRLAHAEQTRVDRQAAAEQQRAVALIAATDEQPQLPLFGDSAA